MDHYNQTNSIIKKGRVTTSVLSETRQYILEM